MSIQKMGAAKDCCGIVECDVSQVCLYGYYWPGTFHATAGGFGDGLCDTCSALSLSKDLPNGTCNRYSTGSIECLRSERWTCPNPTGFLQASQGIYQLDGKLYVNECPEYTAYKLTVSVLQYINAVYCSGYGSTNYPQMALMASDWFLLGSGETIQEAIASGGSAYEMVLPVATIWTWPPLTPLCDFSEVTATLTYTPP